jgi:hypothetical protein
MTDNPFIGLLNMGLSPEQAQSQFDEQRALQIARLKPQERNNMNLYRGITGMARALGAKDPLLEQASQLRALADQFDTSTSKGLMEYAKALVPINRAAAAQAMEMAMKRAEAESKMGEQAAKTRLAEAQATNFTTKETAAAKAVKGRALALQKRFPDMSEEEALGIAEDSKSVAELLKVPKEQAKKTSVVSANGRKLLIDDATGETIKDLGTAGKTLEESLGASLGMMAGVVAKKQAESTGSATGKVVGENIAQIQGKEDALTALRSAQSLVKDGIYSGGYGPTQEWLAKFTPIGSKGRLTNTEQFRSLIGEVVIPRLQEFGGNDSVEELKYLRQVAGGETNLEKKALERILAQAETKIQRGIKRIQDQQKAAETGASMPTTIKPGSKAISWNDLPGGE